MRVWPNQVKVIVEDWVETPRGFRHEMLASTPAGDFETRSTTWATRCVNDRFKALQTFNAINLVSLTASGYRPEGELNASQIICMRA